MYSNDERALIWLNNFNNIAVKKKLLLLDMFMSPSEMFENFKEEKDNIIPLLGENMYSQMAMLREDSYVDKIINDLNLKKVKVLTLASDSYPNKLRDQLVDMPICLYCLGNIELLDTTSIAIVGTRRVTRYGKDVTEKFSRELTLNGFTIVSGMARGVDTIAHKECLNNESKTIAVLGSGIDVVYPKENKDLYADIAEKGLIISEFPLGTEPLAFNFPQRNRIISALADAVLVTEAGLKSGSIITANMALDLGKDIFAIPGSIFSEQSLGTNQLIKDSNNVMMTTCTNDILTHFNICEREFVVDSIQLDFVQQSIVNELEKGKMHFEEILSKTRLDISALFVSLQGLVNAKVIRQLPGNFYELQPK